MKKLMTMIAAVAMSFGLFAEGEATPLENNWTAPADGTSEWNDGKWTGEAAIATVTQGAGYIELKSAGNALSRTVPMTGTSYTMTTNVFFDVNMNLLGQVMDEIPAVDTDAKLALFALDPQVGELSNEGAGLFAIAANPAGGNWLIKFATPIESVTNGTVQLVVKGYSDVLTATGNQPGFRLFLKELDGQSLSPVRISKAFALDGTTVTSWTSAFDANTYLKGSIITGLIQKREYVVLSLKQDDDGLVFSALDFKGNARLAKVNVNDIGVEGIESDLVAETLTFDSTEISVTAVPADAYVDGILVKNGTLTITSLDSTKGLIQIDDNGTKSTIASGAPYEYIFTPNGVITLTAVAVAATVTIDEETTAYATFAEALAAAAEAGTATIALAAGVNVDTLDDGYISIVDGADITFDLNGQVITGVGGDAQSIFYVEGGKLTITDSKTTGKVAPTAGDAVNVMGGACVINAGTFDAKVGFGVESEGAITANGGKFAVEPDSKIDIPEGKTWELKDGYYVLVDAVTTWTATVAAEADEHVTLVSITTNGVAVVNPAAAGNYTINADDEVVVTYALATGYKLAEGSVARVQTLSDEEGKRESVSPTATAIEYTITFESEETGTTVPAATNYTVETTFPFELEDATFEGLGKTFRGWTNETYTTAIRAIDKLPDPLGAITLYAKWEVEANPIDVTKEQSVEGAGDITDPSAKAAMDQNVNALNVALGGPEGVAAWVAKVYGEGNKIPATKLVNTSDDLMAATLAYDLKVMAYPVTITVDNATVGNGFAFTLADNAGDDPVVTGVTKIQQLVKYTAALGTTEFAPSTPAQVAIGAEDDKSFRATFVTGPAAGFMKVDLTVEK